MLNFSFKTCFLLMAIILLVAISNFIFISCGVQKATEQSKQALCKIDSVYKSTIPLEDNRNMNMDLCINEIKESIINMESLKKGIFDSNTITFLSSFVLVFLGGILFDIEKRAKDKLVRTKDMIRDLEKESKETIEKYKIELNQIKIGKRTNTILILSKYLRFQLSANRYQITSDTNVILFELFEAFQDLLSLLQNRKINYITQDAYKEYRCQLRDIELLLDKEEIYNRSDNKNKLTYIYKSKKLLSDCLNEIEKIDKYSDQKGTVL